MLDQADAKRQLEATIEDLYRTFRRYPLNPQMDSGPHCVSEADQQRLRSKPLNQLEADDLERYARKALSTCGNTDDLRHFLPRMFELQVLWPGYCNGLTDPEVLFGKLTYGGWREWPHAEQRAIDLFLVALWRYVLIVHKPTPWTYSDDYICGIAQAIDDMQPFLTTWQQTIHPIALSNLYAFIVQNGPKMISHRKLRNGFMDRRPAQAQQIIDWLLSTDTVRAFEAAFARNSNEPVADWLAGVIDAIQQIQLLCNARESKLPDSKVAHKSETHR